MSVMRGSDTAVILRTSIASPVVGFEGELGDVLDLSSGGETAIALGDIKLRVRDSNRRDVLLPIKIEDDEIPEARFSHDGRLVAIGSGNALSVFSSANGAALLNMTKESASSINSVGFVTRDTRVFAEFSDHKIRVYDIYDRVEVGEITTEATRLNSHGAFADSAGARIAVPWSDRNIRIAPLFQGIVDQINFAQDLMRPLGGEKQPR